MKERPKVSIILSNYNYGDFIREAIDSALNQTYENIEIVVVDDGSTDDSPNIIRSYGNRIKSILQENAGQGSAMNAGFAQSTGDIVIFLDSDDVLLPDCASEVVASWNENLASLHYVPEYIDTKGAPADGGPKAKWTIQTGNLRDEILRYGRIQHRPTTANAFARSYLSKVLPMPEPIWRTDSDVYICFLAALHGEIGEIGKRLCLYREHDSVSSVAVAGQLSRKRLKRVVEEKIYSRRAVEAEAARLNLKCHAGSLLDSPWFLKSYITFKKVSPDDVIVGGDPGFNMSLPKAVSRLVVSALRDDELPTGRKALYMLWAAFSLIAPRAAFERLELSLQG